MTNQDIKTYSARTRPYWQPILDQANAARAAFAIKLTYHTENYQPGQLVANCFPAELEQDAYFELLDMNLNPLLPGYRQLHVLRYAPDRKQRGYQHVANAYGGWYVIPLVEFELVNRQDLQAPVVPPAPVSPAFQLRQPEPEPGAAPVPALSMAPPMAPPMSVSQGYAPPEPEEPEFHYQDDEQQDAHQKELTIRDQYAINFSVPLSNKAWINRMIREGNQLRLEQTQLGQAA